MPRAVALLFALFFSGSACAAAQSSATVEAPTSQTNTTGLDAARKAFETGHAEEALRQLDSLAAIHPEPPGVERLRGFILYQQKNMGAAQAAFAQAVAEYPADRQSLQMRGVALYSLGKPDEAIPLLEQAHAAVSSTNVDPNYVLGLCYILVRRYDDARHAFAAQYGFAPDSAPAYLLAARMLLRRESPAIAEDFARKALALQADLPQAHLLLGEIALARGQLPEAIAEFNRERELSPLAGSVYDRLGDAYLRSGEDVKAQEALSRAVLLEPNAIGPYVLLGKVMLNQQSYLLAALYLERAVIMDPGNYLAHTLLSQAYQRSGRSVESTKELQSADKLQSGGAKLVSLQ